jgi:hypothetical protein
MYLDRSSKAWEPKLIEGAPGLEVIEEITRELWEDEASRLDAVEAVLGRTVIKSEVDDCVEVVNTIMSLEDPELAFACLVVQRISERQMTMPRLQLVK